MKKKKKVCQPYLKPDHKHGKLNKILTLQRDNDIIAMLLDGLETKEIIKYLRNKYGLKHSSANVLISLRRQDIKKRKEFELDNLISIHIHRYEYIYKELLKIGAEGIAMNALKAKEKLMGFHKEGFHMKVNQGQIHQIRTTRVNDEYNLDQLDEKKRQRLEQLLLKAKRDGSDKGTSSVQRISKGV